jgi:hypothetical protein
MVIWHMLKHGTAYRELGADYFDRIEPRRLERQAITRLERLGLHGDPPEENRVRLISGERFSGECQSIALSNDCRAGMASKRKVARNFGVY